MQQLTPSTITSNGMTMANSDLVFYVKCHVKPDRIDEWRAAVDEVIEAMAREDAFVACYLHRYTQDPTLFTLYERWNEPSVEAFVQHQTKPYRQAYDAKLPALLQRPREASILAPLGEWHRGGVRSRVVNHYGRVTRRSDSRLET